MSILKQASNIKISKDDVTFTFLTSGDLQQINYNYLLINQVISNPLDGSLQNIYLRVKEDGQYKYAPLLGVKSNSTFAYSEEQAVWTGTVFGIAYKVTFTLQHGQMWFWDVVLQGNKQEVELFYGQDIGLADEGAVRNNEAYMSQYVGHSVFSDEQLGYVICSRQNQPMSSGFPYIQQGSLTKAVAYTTDGFQFFGTNYKATDEIMALNNPQLASTVYQYEFAYTALQSPPVVLDGEAQFVFYSLLQADHSAAISELEYKDRVIDAWKTVQQQQYSTTMHAVPQVKINETIGEPLQSPSLSFMEVEQMYPNRYHEEWDGDTLLSFFTDTHEHIILPAKEIRVERPHGHIVMSGHNDKLTDKVISSTNYMYGIFHSQIVIGNTTYNKLLSNARNALNMLKTSGQRIYVQLGATYHLLTMPAAYEIGFNYTKWYYKLADDTLIVTAWTHASKPELALQVTSIEQRQYRYLVTNQVVMNEQEYTLPFEMEQTKAESLLFTANEAALSSSVYPHLQFKMDITGTRYQLADERVFANQLKPGCASLVVLQLEPTSSWQLQVSGAITESGAQQQVEETLPQPMIAEHEIAHYRSYLLQLMNGFQLSHPDNQLNKKISKFNTLAWWYTHNMLVHYSVPHGLEQYSGAAWGTRDVCQGPTEYFMAMGNHERVKEIIKIVYMNQYEHDGNWPQWFMFDEYYRIKQAESHGDIIVWPLKVLSDYMRATGDLTILQEKVPYTRADGERTAESHSLFDHMKKELAYIKKHFLHDTALSAYGDGDWDDTLQPANAKLKQYMISSWTVSLTYQVFAELSAILAFAEEYESLAIELQQLAGEIKQDFQHYLVKDGVVSGFAYMEQPEQVRLMLHPSDDSTGIKYRLLPMTRSMISQLFDEEQAADHFELIKEQLYCPDGVRLMNQPATYAGGVSHRFKRAEQAANFGREVGLQYVHAHIRFIEAMAKLGKSDEVWNGLEIINPVGLQEAVPNADWRQSNAYYSSSDGKFPDRYTAAEGFDLLRTGDVQVKGGWRIYSSGPGIYMNQLISNALGIRQFAGDLIVDPVLPASLDGMNLQFEWRSAKFNITYTVQGKEVKRVTLNGQSLPLSQAKDNRYRLGGQRIPYEQIQPLLQDGINQLQIEMN
ncbi:GH36-type glycosyl hydrolase domain-containing protein [Paenibacillus yanchengensis]|uniref:GH36-type glycosyl hydrolase domain-containing protein n=1 Tax=Paenibacillus yanchengensis TaxID=2035833 RepID=A0ABW4YPF1_9BACL